MKRVNAIIGRVREGKYIYSVVMDADDVPFGLNGTGRTIEEAKKDFLEAYDEIRELMAEARESYEDLEFNYIFDIPSFLDYYAYALSLAGLERITGINQRQLSHYINGTSKPRESTVKKFQSGIKAFAKDLSSVDLIWR